MNNMSEFEFINACSPTEPQDPDYRSCRPDGLVYVPHLWVPGAISMAQHLRQLKQYRDSSTVLIVDDGVASALAPAIQQDRKQLYLLDPLDGSIVCSPSWSPWKYNLQGFPPQSSFSRLPWFDLVLTGCHGMVDGCLYTSGVWLIKAFGELRRLGPIGGDTVVVALVNPCQRDINSPYNEFLAHAFCAIVGGMGVTYAGNP